MTQLQLINKLVAERNSLVAEEEQIEVWDITDNMSDLEAAISYLQNEIESLKAE